MVLTLIEVTLTATVGSDLSLAIFQKPQGGISAARQFSALNRDQFSNGKATRFPGFAATAVLLLRRKRLDQGTNIRVQTFRRSDAKPKA